MLENHRDPTTTTLDAIFRFVNELHANENEVGHDTFIVTYLFILA